MNIKKSTYIGQVFKQYKLNIIDSGHALVDSEWNAAYVCSPFSRLYYAAAGSASLSVKGKQILLEPGHFYLIPLGTEYSCSCPSEFDHLYFHINIDAPNGYDLLRGAVCVSGKISCEKIRHLIDLYFDSSIFSQLELQYEIYRSLQALLKLQPKSPDIEGLLSPDIAKTVGYIKSNLSAQLTTEEIAKNLYLSKNTLAKRFKCEVGIPIGKYIDKLIFFEAEKLLSKSSLSIREISASLGFSDQFYFSRRFYAMFEETPSAYRKRVRSFTT